MIKTLKRSLPMISAWLFWLLPLAGLPLAFARLSGNKKALFGMVQMVNFPELGLISLAVLLLNMPRLAALLRESRALRFTATAGGTVILVSGIQQWLYGGSWEHIGTALFYAATPLAAAASAPRLKKALPGAAAAIAVLLLYSGVISENFTGLTGNWNWTQVLCFAFLPAFFVRFKTGNFIKYALTSFFVFLAAGSFFYPAELSVTLVIAVPLLCAGFLVWFKMPRRLRPAGAAVSFVLLTAFVLALGIWCTANDSRIQLFASTVQLLKTHGVIGVGPGRFFDFIQEFMVPGYFLAPFSAPHHPHPHNEILHLWSSFGIAGIFFTGAIFCGVLNKFPLRSHASAKTLLPFWIFFLFFICGQSDLTGAILPGAFWMLTAAGIAMTPRYIPKPPPRHRALPLIFAALIAIALFSAILNLRASSLVRQGRLAIQRNQPQQALNFYQESIKLKPGKEAIYGCAEIALHGFNDPRSTLYFLQMLHDELGFYNYLHTNRMKAVALVNTGDAPTALKFIKKDLRAYPASVINNRLHLDLLKLLKADRRELDQASRDYLRSCQLRQISPQRGNMITMVMDDQPVSQAANSSRHLTYPRLFPGVVNEIIAALTLLLAALGAGALVCRSSRAVITELACGITVLALSGAFIPAKYTPMLLIILAPVGIIRNYPKVMKYKKESIIFFILLLFALGGALLPPHAWDEQVYQISLLKHYSENGFFSLRSDNPYSAYPSLCHAFLLTAFDWGGATLPRLITLLIYGVSGSFLLAKLRKYGSFFAFAILAALLLSPLNLLLIRNFYAEPFLMLFGIAGAVVLFSPELNRQDILLAGVMAGSAVAVKLTGAGTAAGLLVLLLFRSFKFKTLLIFSGGALASSAVFFLRTMLFWGNPFYPYGSRFIGAGESACMVEKFHTVLGGHYGLNRLYGTLAGWLFTSVKPELYDGIDCGFQFSLLFAVALAGGCIAAKKFPDSRRLLLGAAAGIAAAYIFWGLTARQSRFLFTIFFWSALLTSIAVEKLPSLWKNILAAILVILTVISIIKQPIALMHFYYAWRVISHARQMPAGFCARDDKGYADLLYKTDRLPPQARIALLTERRTLYMPRAATLLMPHFQETLTPVPDDEKKLFEVLEKFDYIVIRIPRSDVDRTAEYDDEMNKLYRLLQQLLDQGKLVPVPDSEMMILRVVTSAAGTASASKSASSASVESSDAALRREDGKPRPLR